MINKIVAAKNVNSGNKELQQIFYAIYDLTLNDGFDPEGKQLYIDPDECIDCGACEPECPVEAIFEESELPEEWSRYTEINAKWFAQ